MYGGAVGWGISRTGEQKMTDLKTLQDIPCALRKELIDVNDLRLEAIKWIQHYDDPENYWNKVDKNESAKAFIKYFFNIGEEELR